MKYLLAIAIAALLVTSAHAENWGPLGVTPAGNIIELDTDSIHNRSDGSIHVIISEGGDSTWVAFDCDGHWGSPAKGAQLRHIPHGSIAEEAAIQLCPLK